MNQQQTNPQFAKKALVLAMAAIFAAPAGAQQDSRAVEEIIVTAEKREESIQDVGLSISAFDADGLAKGGIVDVTRLNFLVPGVNYAFAGNDAKFNVRGANSTETFSDNSSIVGRRTVLSFDAETSSLPSGLKSSP